MSLNGAQKSFSFFGLPISLAVILVSVLNSCSERHLHEDKAIFKYNEAAGIVNLDPAFSRDQAHIWVCNQLYNGLVQLDDRLSVVPAIAESWSISEDGTTYTFHLRNDVYFHQSEVFEQGTRKATASDFVFSFNR